MGRQGREYRAALAGYALGAPLLRALRLKKIMAKIHCMHIKLAAALLMAASFFLPFFHINQSVSCDDPFYGIISFFDACIHTQRHHFSIFRFFIVFFQIVPFFWPTIFIINYFMFFRFKKKIQTVELLLSTITVGYFLWLARIDFSHVECPDRFGTLLYGFYITIFSALIYFGCCVKGLIKRKLS